MSGGGRDAAFARQRQRRDCLCAGARCAGSVCAGACRRGGMHARTFENGVGNPPDLGLDVRLGGAHVCAWRRQGGGGRERW
jgi:hypothetical protein